MIEHTEPVTVPESWKLIHEGWEIVSAEVLPDKYWNVRFTCGELHQEVGRGFTVKLLEALDKQLNPTVDMDVINFPHECDKADPNTYWLGGNGHLYHLDLSAGWTWARTSTISESRHECWPEYPGISAYPLRRVDYK